MTKHLKSWKKQLRVKSSIFVTSEDLIIYLNLNMHAISEIFFVSFLYCKKLVNNKLRFKRK